MSDHLWRKLPEGFLKKSAKGWMRLDHDVRLLVAELARAQSFKCAFCRETKKLVIDHNHYPLHGRSDKFTVYNVRGLVCSRCNWHIGMYEADERGDYRGWDDAYIRISEQELYPYGQAYDHRVLSLIEREIECQLGPLNYSRRCLFLQKFDDWREWGGRYPWRSYFAEIKQRHRSKIRTPKQFLKSLAAIARFVIDQKQKNPGYEPPPQFIELLIRVKPTMDDIWPEIEERYRTIQAERQASRSLESCSRRTNALGT